MPARKGTRKCVACGNEYARKSYGWTYGVFCSHHCRITSPPRSKRPNDRTNERHDCVYHKQCFDEAAVENRKTVCPPNCVRYVRSLEPVKRAVADLHSHAWMCGEN